MEDKVEKETLEGILGIGHARWATHGEPNDVNSHPNISQSGSIAVVHNGIIENYMKLKEFLQSKGYTFRSETYTEVIAHLVEYHYKGDLVQAVMETISELVGSYALGVICKDCADTFVASRKDSPLIVGLGKGENFIASDIPAIIEYTRDIYILVGLGQKNFISMSERLMGQGIRVTERLYYMEIDGTLRKSRFERGGGNG